MTPWRHPFFKTTRGRLVALLRRGRLTVEDMATALGITDNAVRAQLAALERDGLVEQQGVRRGGRKPSYAYGLTAEFEPALSRAYAPLLVQLLGELSEHTPGEKLAELLRTVGQRWAAELPPAHGSRRTRAADAVALLEQLGGATELEEHDGQLVIRGFACPLALAVREHPEVCTAVESLLEKVTGMAVRERCDRRGDTPSCRFAIIEANG
jgi:predicted ArsR family transcriptional regulator